MTKTAQRHELALADLDAVIGGSASPTYFHPVAIQATGTIPGAGFSSTHVTPSAANNYGLADHFNLMFPAMAHEGGHAAEGMAPSVPGCHGAAGTDGHAPQTAALPLSLMPVPGQLSAPAAPAPVAAAAPADSGAALYFGLPGGTAVAADPTHGDTSHAGSNDWAPGSFGGSAPANSATGW